MQEHISKTKFKAQALEIMRGIEDTGEEVIITSHGKPTLMIRRYSEDQVDPLKQLKGSVLQFDDPTAPVSDDDWDLA